MMDNLYHPPVVTPSANVRHNQQERRARQNIRERRKKGVAEQLKKGKALRKLKSDTKEPPQKKSRALTSDVWTNGAFSYKKKTDGSLDKSYVVCGQCREQLSKHSGTGNMANHMKAKHKAFWGHISGGKSPSISKYVHAKPEWK